MKLTPLDILHHVFRKRFWGYDPGEVDAFLELVRNEYEAAIRENHQLKEELQRVSAELASLKEKEEILKDTMITVQKVREEIEQNARKEAEIILAEAKMKAQEIVNTAQLRSIEIFDEIKELRRQKIKLVQELKSILTTHLKLLEVDEEPEGTNIEERIEFISRKGEES